jgi:parallel beta-helix repeat protein
MGIRLAYDSPYMDQSNRARRQFLQNTVLSGAAAVTGMILVRNPAQAATTTAPTAGTPFVNVMTDFGAVGDGKTSDTLAFQNAVAYLNSRGGGVLWVPFANYAVNLNLSGANAPIIIEGSGSTFRPVSSSQSAVLTINNSGSTGAGYGYSNLIFRNCGFTGLLQGSGSGDRGDVNYAVFLSGSAAIWQQCTFAYGKMASLSSFYGQYNEFYECLFTCSVATPSSAGCFLSGNGDLTSSNECIFSRCKFISNSNGLVIHGGFKNRVDNCTFQDTRAGGTAGLVLDTDGSQGNVATTVYGCYFEVNNCRDMFIGIAEDTVVLGCFFSDLNGVAPLSSKVASLETVSLFNVTVQSCSFYNASPPNFNAAHNFPTLLYLGNTIDANISGGDGRKGVTGTSPNLLIDSPSNRSVNFGYKLLQLSGYYGAPGLQLGGHTLWVDAAGNLRIKNGLPTSDTDGVAVGSQA